MKTMHYLAGYVVKLCAIATFCGMGLACTNGAGDGSVRYEKVREESVIYKVEPSGRIGYIDAEGNLVTEIKYAAGPEFIRGAGGVSISSERKRTSLLLSAAGHELTEPVYITVDRYMVNERILFSKTRGKFGYLNADGEVVIPEGYHGGTCFHDGVAFVGVLSLANNIRRLLDSGGVEAEEWYIDTNGGRIILDEEEEIAFRIGSREDAREPSAYIPVDLVDLHPVQGQDDLWGYADGDGAVVIEPRYREAGQFRSLLALVEKQSGEKWYVNSSGEYVSPYNISISNGGE